MSLSCCRVFFSLLIQAGCIMMVLPSSAVFHPVLTRWDLDFCLWHVGSCFPKRIERFLLPSQSTWQSLNSQGMFSASSLWDVLSLSACFIFATFWPCYKTLLHRSVLLRTAHVLVVLVCCTKHDVMRRCRGLVLTSPFSVFFTREVGLCGTFLLDQEGEGQEKQGTKQCFF